MNSLPHTRTPRPSLALVGERAWTSTCVSGPQRASFARRPVMVLDPEVRPA